MGKYFDVTLQNVITNKSYDIKMEAGVSFENKKYRYTMTKSGKLSIFNKETKETTTGSKINLADYQYKTMQAVINNNEELDDTDVLSVDDVQGAIELSKENKLGEDLGEFLTNNYKVQNPKAFENENKFSAYIKNGNANQSAVLAFKFEKEYYNAKIKNITTGEVEEIKMEKGVSFENNGAIYRMNNDGLLSVYDKDKEKWVAGNDTINMTNYQLNAFKAVVNNVSETIDGKVSEVPILSKNDIDDALNKYKSKELSSDLSEFLTVTSGYKVGKIRSFSKNNAFYTYVTNGNKKTSAALVFKYGSAKGSVAMSDFVNNEVVDNDVKIVSNRGGNPNAGNISKYTPSANCKSIVKKYEGYRSTAYKCPAGVWTIGWGHTKGVRRGQSITSKQAEQYLSADLNKAAKIVKSSVKVKLTQNQFDALVSFVFNVGEGNFKTSTLLKCINAGDFTGASQQFSRWVYAGNKVQRGLVNRRSEEIKLFNK